MQVFNILAQKGNVVVTVGEDDPVTAIADSLIRHNIGSVPVMDTQGRLVGLISERMIVKAFAERPDDLAILRARDVMLRDVPTARPDDTLQDVACRMTFTRSRHMPVIEDGHLAGIVSIGDVVKFRADTAEQEAQDLQHYVTGSDHASVQPPHAPVEKRCNLETGRMS